MPPRLATILMASTMSLSPLAVSCAGSGDGDDAGTSSASFGPGSPGTDAADTMTTPPPGDGTGTTGDPGTAGTTEAAVNATFDAYREALVARDGEAAVRQVTPNTLTWFDGIRLLAVSAPPAELADPATPLVDAITAIQMRASLGDEVVTADNGEALFRIGVEQGLVGSDVASAQIDGVEELSATEAYALISGTRAFRFEDAGDGWKIDLQSAVDTLANEGTDEQLVGLLSGGTASTREELFAVLATANGTTWTELGQPLQ